MAASREAAVISPIFFLAISSTCDLEIVPADSRPGFLEASWRPRAFLIRAETGGSLVTKVKDLSS